MDIYSKVVEIISSQLRVDPASITESSAIVEDLGADSLDIVDLVMSLEEEFEVEIPSEDLEGIATIGDVKKYIEAHK
mgnify:CR=1 FL=1